MLYTGEPLSVLLQTLGFCKCKQCHKVILLKVLPCLHSFCDSCLSGPGRRICPVCRITYAEDPPANTFISCLTELKSVPSAKLCRLCLDDGTNTNATDVCLSCRDGPRYLCKRCKRFHDMCTGRPSHHTVTVTEFAENGSYYRPTHSHTICERHNKQFKLACQRCLRIMCTLCVTVSNCPVGGGVDKHLCDELERTVQKCKKEISGMMAAGNERKEEMRQQVEEVKKERELVTLPGYESLWDSVKVRYSAAGKALVEEREKVLESIDTLTSGRLKKTDVWLKKTDESRRELNTCYKEGERALMYFPPAEVLEVTKTMRGAVLLKPSPLELKPMPKLAHIHKCTDEEISELVQKLVGAIQSAAPVVGNTVQICPEFPFYIHGGYPHSHLGVNITNLKLARGTVIAVVPYNGTHFATRVNYIGKYYTVQFPQQPNVNLMDTEVVLVD